MINITSYILALKYETIFPIFHRLTSNFKLLCTSAFVGDFENSVVVSAVISIHRVGLQLIPKQEPNK